MSDRAWWRIIARLLFGYVVLYVAYLLVRPWPWNRGSHGR